MVNVFRVLYNRRGFSLVELLIALSLLGIVLALGYDFFFFGDRSFNIGSKQSIVQRDIRTASEFISKELRNATEVELRDTADNLTGYKYIYRNAATSKIVYTASGAPSSEVVINSLNFELEKLTNNKNLVKFTIQGTLDTQTYTINSKVYLNNISNKAPLTKPVIKYKTP